MKVVRWAGDVPRNVAFVETRHPESDAVGVGSVFAMLRVEPLNWVLAHWMGFLLLLSLSAAAILGRPRAEPSPGADRPVAHAEALGDLLRRTRDSDAARDLLDAYRRWRHPKARPETARPQTQDTNAKD